MFPNRPGAAAARAALAGPARPDLVGRCLGGDRVLGRRARHEPDEPHPGLRRRERRSVPRRPGPAHRGVSRGVEGGGERPQARAARLGQPAALRRSSTTVTAGTSAAAAATAITWGYIDDRTRAIFSPHVRGRARRARGPARAGRGDHRRRHAPCYCAQPARGRVQRARGRERSDGTSLPRSARARPPRQRARSLVPEALLSRAQAVRSQVIPSYGFEHDKPERLAGIEATWDLGTQALLELARDHARLALVWRPARAAARSPPGWQSTSRPGLGAGGGHLHDPR